jgi:hypothetical protein
MTFYLPIAGTWGWDRGGPTRWWEADSPFTAFMLGNGLQLVAGGEDPFIWSTDANGATPWNRGKHHDWKAGGLNLRRYCKPGPQGSDEGAHYVPYESRNFIAHSHGLQVVLYAAAAGLRIHRLVSVSSPVRKDMAAVAAAARPNIGEWVHLASDRSDAVQWLGELFDGAFGIVREHPLADINVCIKKVGHSRLLEDPTAFPEWKTPRPPLGNRGVVEWLSRANETPAAA